MGSLRVIALPALGIACASVQAGLVTLLLCYLVSVVSVVAIAAIPVIRVVSVILTTAVIIVVSTISVVAIIIVISSIAVPLIAVAVLPIGRLSMDRRRGYDGESKKQRAHKSNAAK